MQRLGGVRNPLLEASFVRRGSRLNFRHGGGARLDPVTQQLLPLTLRLGRRVSFASWAREMLPCGRRQRFRRCFLRAVQLEENPATIQQAAEIYAAILVMRPQHAPALINLGTIHYNLRRFEDAEGALSSGDGG